MKAAEGSAKAAADSTLRKPKPKMGDYDAPLLTIAPSSADISVIHIASVAAADNCSVRA